MHIFQRFLDCRTFATCSDDTTVALWDIRNLKQKMRTLRGHSNWVKNIEFVRDEGLLVTSGFDGCVFTWDINSYTEEGNFPYFSLTANVCNEILLIETNNFHRIDESKSFSYQWANENEADSR